MATNVGSVLFGFIYMALWHATAQGHRVGSFTPHALVAYIAVTPSVLWVTTFLPRDLGIAIAVRTGQIATDFGRPVGFLPRTVAVALGDVAYNAIFRSLPLVLAFVLAGAFPWRQFLSLDTDGAFLLALAVGAMTGILLLYLMGMSSFWTFDTRWARRLYFALTVFAGGQILPLQLMPQSLRHILIWLPFQNLVWFPVSVALHRADGVWWLSGGLWVVLLAWLAYLVTVLAMRRVEIQGG